MKLYPISASLSQRTVLVVGGGAAAERKVAAPRDTEVHVAVNVDKLEMPDCAPLAQERQRLAICVGVGEPGTLRPRLIESGRAACGAFAGPAGARRGSRPGTLAGAVWRITAGRLRARIASGYANFSESIGSGGPGWIA